MPAATTAQISVHRAMMAAIGLGLAFYCAFLLKKNCFFAGGPDSSGYANEAKLLATGHVIKDVPLMRAWTLDSDLIYVFTPLGFARGRAYATMVPTYPAGVSIHEVVLAKIGGWRRAPFLVGPLMATGCLLLMVAIAAELGLPLLYGVACGAVLGAVPVFLAHAIQPVSDVVATFWALAAIFLALRSERRGVAWVLAAGVAFAAGVWVRPTNFFVALPLAFAMRWRVPRLALAALAALPLGLALGWYNYTLYGHPLRTGYGSFTDVVTWSAFRDCFPFHTRGLVEMLTPMVMPVGLLVAFDRATGRWHRALLLTWFGVFFCFYIFYGVCDGWRSYRFLLPAAPSLIFASALVLRHAQLFVAAHSSPRFASVVALLVALSLVGLQIRTGRALAVFDVRHADEVFPGTIAWAEPQLPGDAIVLAGLMSGPFLYYADRQTIRWDQMDQGDRVPKLRAAAKKAHRRWFAVLSSLETTPHQFEAWQPSRWEPVEMYRDVTLWRLVE